jgi:hypothetical protein
VLNRAELCLPCQPCILGGGVPGSGWFHRPHDSLEPVGLPPVYQFNLPRFRREVTLAIAGGLCAADNRNTNNRSEHGEPKQKAT